jgi:hypothetical protein
MYGTKKLKFYHFNARPLVQKDVKKYLETKGLKVITHPTYSPDLALYDFDLKFIYKQRLSNHFDCERLSHQITVMVSEIPEFEYRKDLNKWIEIMQASIKYQGHYSAHLIEKIFQKCRIIFS